MSPAPTPTPRTDAAKAAHEKWRWLGWSEKQRSSELKAPSGWEFSAELERELAEAKGQVDTAEALLVRIQVMTHCDSHNRTSSLGEIRELIRKHRMDLEGVTEEDCFIPESDRT